MRQKLNVMNVSGVNQLVLFVLTVPRSYALTVVTITSIVEGFKIIK